MRKLIAWQSSLFLYMYTVCVCVFLIVFDCSFTRFIVLCHLSIYIIYHCEINSLCMRIMCVKKKVWKGRDLPLMQALSPNKMLLCDYSPREQCLLTQSCPWCIASEYNLLEKILQFFFSFLSITFEISAISLSKWANILHEMLILWKLQTIAPCFYLY